VGAGERVIRILLLAPYYVADPFSTSLISTTLFMVIHHRYTLTFFIIYFYSYKTSPATRKYIDFLHFNYFLSFFFFYPLLSLFK
jgi:hypothetical protein